MRYMSLLVAAGLWSCSRPVPVQNPYRVLKEDRRVEIFVAVTRKVPQGMTARMTGQPPVTEEVVLSPTRDVFAPGEKLVLGVKSSKGGEAELYEQEIYAGKGANFSKARPVTDKKNRRPVSVHIEPNIVTKMPDGGWIELTACPGCTAEKFCVVFREPHEELAASVGAPVPIDSLNRWEGNTAYVKTWEYESARPAIFPQRKGGTERGATYVPATSTVPLTALTILQRKSDTGWQSCVTLRLNR